VRIGDFVLASATDEAASGVVAYVGPDHHLFAGTLRDNVVLPLRRAVPRLPETSDREERWRRTEAERSGNPVAPTGDEWVVPSLAGARDAEELDTQIMHVLDLVGLGDDVRRFGLQGRLDPRRDREAVEGVLAVRRTLHERLEEPRLRGLVEPFDPARFNLNATIAENLLFGLPTGERFADGEIASDPFVRSILQAEALVVPLIRTGLRMAETALEIFEGLPQGHPLTRRFSFVSSDELPEYRTIVELARQRRDVTRLPAEVQGRLVGLAFAYVEPRYRLGLVDEVFKARLLRARQSIRLYLPQAYANEIAFYDPRRYIAAASIRDNLLLGRVAYGVADAEARVERLITEALREAGLARTVDRIGLGFEVGPGGRLLYAQQRAALALARGLIARPQILVLDGALGAFGPGEASRLIARLMKVMEERTLVATVPSREDAAAFDRVLAFEGPRLTEDRSATRTIAEPPDETRRALEAMRSEHV
jgi:putative ABC transport system ATP-binding protein